MMNTVDRKPHNGLLWLFLLLLLAVGWTGSVANAKAIVDLQPSSVVSGDEVYLRDIAVIQGAGSAQKEILGSVVVGQTPGYARSSQLRRSYILAQMKHSLIDMNAVVVRGPEKVEIRTDGLVIKSEKLARMTEDYVLQQTEWNAENVTFEWGRMPADQKLPPGELKVDVWKVSGDFYGLTHFRSEIRVDGKPVITVPMVVKIHRYEDVLVARGDLTRGEIVEGKDLQLRRFDLSKLSIRERKGFCRPQMPPVGKRLKSYVQAGRVLVYDMLADPPIVERGEQVVIEIKRGEVYVTARGEARASATVGEKVPVRSFLSDKIIMARVVRPGTVTVD